MYGVVLMAMMTTAPDAPAFHKQGGCAGQQASGCVSKQGCTSQQSSCHGLFGGRIRERLHRHNSNGCCGCQGTPAAAPASAPQPMPKKVGDAPIKTNLVNATDALNEVNSVRAARGLPAYQLDDKLAVAAQACADYRAAHGIPAHTRNDFQFLPAGAHASAAGCNIATMQYDGWAACCTFDRQYTHAGAAKMTDRLGRVYYHIFVR